MATKKTTTERRTRPTYDELSPVERDFLAVHRDIKQTIAKAAAGLPRVQAEELVDRIVLMFEDPDVDMSERGQTLFRKMGAQYRLFAMEQFEEASHHG